MGNTKYREITSDYIFNDFETYSCINHYGNHKNILAKMLPSL